MIPGGDDDWTEVSVPVQVVFVTMTTDGVVLDCILAAEVRTGAAMVIPAGVPFSIIIDGPVDGPERSVEALDLLESWSAHSVVVQAMASATTSRLVLRHDTDELVLDVL